jgi:hypothetical protein
MKDIEAVNGVINRTKMQMHSLKDQIHSLKEEDISIKFYLSNLKRLSLQALDLLTAMEKQVDYFKNQKRSLQIKENLKKQQRRRHGVPMVR